MADFYSGTRPGTTVTRGSATFELPILYFRDDLFATFHTADLRRVRAVLPSERLHPVITRPGRALVGIVAFNYLETSIGPYGEVGFVVPVVHGGRPPLPLLPGLLEASYPGFGYLVLHLPVTRLLARNAGRGEWGYPKFVADMRFALTPEHLECRLSDGATPILTLRVGRCCGFTVADRRPLVTYSVRGDELIRTVIPQRGVARNAINPHASLELGTGHPMAETIRALGLSERPLISRYYLERSGILPAGQVVERGVRPLEGHRGEDREGEHTATYL